VACPTPGCSYSTCRKDHLKRHVLSCVRKSSLGEPLPYSSSSKSLLKASHSSDSGSPSKKVSPKSSAKKGKVKPIVPDVGVEAVAE